MAVVLAAAGYPGTPTTGGVITGLEAATTNGSTVIHAGTALDQQGNLVSAGGRVLAVVGLGEDIEAARGRAYESIKEIQLEDPSTAMTSRRRCAAGGELRRADRQRAGQPLRLAGDARCLVSPRARSSPNAGSGSRCSAAQSDLGVDFGGDDPAVVIKAYEGVIEQVDLASIAERRRSPGMT